MDFREYSVSREGNEVVINGTIREPVHWDFSIRMCEDDLPGLIKVAGTRKMLGFLLKAMFKRNRDAHWSGDRDEHLAAVKAAIEARKEAEASGGDDAETKKKEARQAARSGRAGRSGTTAKPESPSGSGDESSAADTSAAESGAAEPAATEAAAAESSAEQASAAKAQEPLAAASASKNGKESARSSGKSVSFARPKVGPEHKRSKASGASGPDGNGSSDGSEATVSTGASEGTAT